MGLRDLVTALDSLARTGWMLRGVPASMAETVSQHSFKAAIIALRVSEILRDMGLEINPLKAASIALIHDLAEAFIGDIVPTHRGHAGKESEEYIHISVEVGSDLITGLFREYMDMDSVEAVVARLADRLSTMLMAKHYSGLGYDTGKLAEKVKGEVEELIKTYNLPIDPSSLYILLGIE